MPRVVFVNEHRIVEADAGKNLAEVAAAAGVLLGRPTKDGRQRACHPLFLRHACRCWVEEGAPGAAGPRTPAERLLGLRGWQRLACRARLAGDVRVFSLPAVSNRVGTARAIAPPPAPTVDPEAKRKRPDAASTAEFTKGHPASIGRPRAEEPDAPAPVTDGDPAPPATTS